MLQAGLNNGPDAPSARRPGVWRRAPLLPYCLGMFIFAALAWWLLPGLADVAAALGTTEALEALPAPAEQVVKLQGALPDISALAGLILLGKTSLALAALQLLLSMGARVSPLLPRLALWLGLAHALFAALLLARAAWELGQAPELYLSCLSAALRAFAGGGFAFWLAGVAGLLALLELARRNLRLVAM